MRHRGLLWLVAAILGGCHSSNSSPADDEGGPVTITFLRHDNPNYRIADDVYFAEYVSQHPNVTIADTTVDFKTLSTSLNGDLKNNQFSYDLVLIPSARLCSFAD